MELQNGPRVWSPVSCGHLWALWQLKEMWRQIWVEISENTFPYRIGA